MEEQTVVGEVCPQGGEVHSEWRKREFYFAGRFNSMILSPGVFDRVFWLLSAIFGRREPIALETSWVVEKNLKKVERSGRFRTGICTLAALLILREKVIKPVLAGAGKPKPGRPLKRIHPLDAHYENLQRELRRTFHTLGLAA